MAAICELLNAALPNVDWKLTEYNVKAFQFPTERELELADGCIIPGSSSSAYDDEPWIHALQSFIRTRLHRRRVKTMGICFGHQIIAQALGGSVKRNPRGVRAAAQSFRLMNGAEKLLLLEDRGGRADMPRRNHAETMSLPYHHGDVVERLPSCGRLLGVSDECPCHAAAYFTEQKSNPHFITVQGHPEFATKTGEKCLRDIIDADERKPGFTREWAEDARANISAADDVSLEITKAVARALWLRKSKQSPSK